MNHFVPSVRHVLALTGAALAGTVAALAFASPASAHHSEVTGQAVCDLATGEFVVNWTITSNAPAQVTHYRLASVELTPAGSTVTNIAETGAGQFPHAVATPLTGVQRLPGNATSASLTVEAQWKNLFNEEKPRTGTVQFNGVCAKPSATFATVCDGKVTVTLENNATFATATATLVVTGKDGWTSPPQVLEPGKETKVEVPAANSAEVKVLLGETVIATGGRALPANCGGLPVTGVKIGTAVGGALGLLGLGSMLFVAARRRRIRFTA